MKKVTMQDIADQLGISKNSVSQALGNKKGVSLRTKQIVNDKAAELGYHYKKRNNESNLKRENKHPVYALFATEFVFSQKSFFGEILLSIEREISKNNGDLETFCVSAKNIESQGIPGNFRTENYQGLFILSHIEQHYIEMLLALGLPSVLIDHHDPHLAVDCVLTQNKTGAFLATEYLIKLGHQKIGFIGDIQWSPSYEERLEGYRKALNLYRLPYENKYAITQIKEERTALFKTLDSLSVGLSGWPTAWLCANSGLGFILISYFQSKGLKIPDDIAVCCFDNTEITLLSNPQITAVGTDLVNMGQKSVQLLEWRADHKEEPYMHLTLSTHLIERGSTRKSTK